MNLSVFVETLGSVVICPLPQRVLNRHPFTGNDISRETSPIETYIVKECDLPTKPALKCCLLVRGKIAKLQF